MISFTLITYVTGYEKTIHSPHFVETEINTPSEHLLLITMVLSFFSIRLSCAKLWAFECKQYASWFRLHVVLIMHVNSEHVGLSGSVRGRTIVWKYAYKNLMLHSGSPTHSVVMHVRSSTRDRSSRIDYWTLNSRNVSSMFAASGQFFHSRSHI